MTTWSDGASWLLKSLIESQLPVPIGASHVVVRSSSMQFDELLMSAHRELGPSIATSRVTAIIWLNGGVGCGGDGGTGKRGGAAGGVGGGVGAGDGEGGGKCGRRSGESGDGGGGGGCGGGDGLEGEGDAAKLSRGGIDVGYSCEEGGCDDNEDDASVVACLLPAKTAFMRGPMMATVAAIARNTATQTTTKQTQLAALQPSASRVLPLASSSTSASVVSSLRKRFAFRVDTFRAGGSSSSSSAAARWLLLLLLLLLLLRCMLVLS